MIEKHFNHGQKRIRETFQSWIETDYLDTADNGSANKRLLGSYATSYIDMIDRIAPVAPKASNITTQDTAIKGTAEANTTNYIKL